MSEAEPPSPLLLKLTEVETNQKALACTVTWVTKELEEGIQRYVPLLTL